MRLFRHKLVLVSAVVAVLGALLVVGSVLAETPTPTPDKPRFNFGDTFLTHLAQNLGVDKARLVEQMKAAAGTTVDDAVQQGALSQEHGDRIKEQIQKSNGSFFNGGFVGPHRFGHRARPGFAFGKLHQPQLLQAAAQKLGLTEAQLRDELKSGKSLAQIAQEKGVSRDDLRTAMLDAVRSQVNQAVQNGKLTQDQANQVISRIEQVIDRLIDAAPRQPKPKASPTPQGA